MAVVSTTTPTTLPPSGTASGDLSGTYPSPTVAKLQGRAVGSGAPSDQQGLVWVNANTDWEPAPIANSVFGRTGAVVAASGDYTAAQVTNALAQGNALLGVTVIQQGTTSYVAPAGAKKLWIRGWGAGSSGSGCASSGATTSMAIGAPGCPGAYAEKTLTTNIGTHTVAVGAGGAAPGAGSVSLVGGDTLFADSLGANVLTAKGGPASTGQQAGGTGATVGTPTGAAAGNVGDFTATVDGGTFVRINGGTGWTEPTDPPGGGGTPMSRLAAASAGADGAAGRAPGGGGGGGIDTNVTARNGGAGANGLLIVFAYG